MNSSYVLWVIKVEPSGCGCQQRKKWTAPSRKAFEASSFHRASCSLMEVDPISPLTPPTSSQLRKCSEFYIPNYILHFTYS
ncbi:hypothetical protein T01_4785 [Trichinella spiralis]|uniref:Uncharacterized protein n=1 Tax=Trichinella spiralis TaxID=6334 RepID=A0A0V1B1K0_TRISP|nr:hypothetical protein T01_4785 [Trichinella spiralis]